MAEIAFPELEMVDGLIAGLEALLVESDETPLRIDSTHPPKRAIYKIFGGGGPSERRVYHAEALFLDDTRLVLRCQDTHLVKQTPVQVTIQAEKSGRGEVIAIFKGKVKDLKRVQGGYDVFIEIAETNKLRVTAAQKLRDFVAHGDAMGWNRWCHDIPGIIELVGMDLRSVDLNGFDLCCADLTGSDLTGANLSGAIMSGSILIRCVIKNVTAVGTDLFAARLSRNHASLLQQSGMPEVDSVIIEGSKAGTRIQFKE